jgi:hypothetical protein
LMIVTMIRVMTLMYDDHDDLDKNSCRWLDLAYENS